MSIVCAAIKGGEIAIAADTQTSYGSLCVSAAHLYNCSKLFEVNDSIVGLVGWSAIEVIVEHLLRHETKLFRLHSRAEITDTLHKLHDKMKTDHYLETFEDRNQPVESSQLDALIINPRGLFMIGSYREVNEFKTFWAIGSGRNLALGAMHALHAGRCSARTIVEAGVRAAAEFNDGCALPLESGVMNLAVALERPTPAKSVASLKRSLV